MRGFRPGTTYTGRGAAHVVNRARNTQGIKKSAISALSSIVPTVACNLLYFASFGKDGKNAISEVSALTTANVVSNVLEYFYEKWQKSQVSEEPTESIGETTPLI